MSGMGGGAERPLRLNDNVANQERQELEITKRHLLEITAQLWQSRMKEAQLEEEINANQMTIQQQDVTTTALHKRVRDLETIVARQRFALESIKNDLNEHELASVGEVGGKGGTGGVGGG